MLWYRQKYQSNADVRVAEVLTDVYMQKCKQKCFVVRQMCLLGAQMCAVHCIAAKNFIVQMCTVVRKCALIKNKQMNLVDTAPAPQNANVNSCTRYKLVHDS